MLWPFFKAARPQRANRHWNVHTWGQERATADRLLAVASDRPGRAMQQEDEEWKVIGKGGGKKGGAGGEDGDVLLRVEEGGGADRQMHGGGNGNLGPAGMVMAQMWFCESCQVEALFRTKCVSAAARSDQTSRGSSQKAG